VFCCPSVIRFGRVSVGLTIDELETGSVQYVNADGPKKPPDGVV
jgi:hypothetical protein